MPDSLPLNDFVVLVDDEPAVRDTTSFLLSAEGLPTFTATDGVEGLDAVRHYRPKCAIIDAKLPEMDGIELCRAIRADAALAGMFLIVLTGRGTKDLEREAREAGADRYIEKPYEVDELIKLVKVVFAGTPTT